MLAAGAIGIAAFLISKTKKNKNSAVNKQTQPQTALRNQFVNNNISSNLSQVYKDFTLKQGINP